ncbi:MAG TPA: hypothetical protein VLT89_16505 [Usitatibacter sp.]|nr:hypothetical protein [Usitatibacter sp.]
MNRVTAIGLASLVAYGLLIASKYAGIVSAAHEERPQASAVSDEAALRAFTGEPRGESAPSPVSLPPPIQRPERMRLTPASLDFRAARDLKAFADNLNMHRAVLTGDERYNLARALEECQFTTNINEDLAAYSAKQRRQFLAGLTPGDPNSARRIAAYDASDNTQRCLHFQGTRISQKDIDELYNAAAQQGDARAQARLLVADLNAKIAANSKNDAATPPAAVNGDDMSRIIGLLESRDPEAMMIVGGLLAQSAIANQLHVGPNGEVPEPSAFLGAFQLVACDETADCTQLSRDPQLACAYSGYCDATTFEELYQNFMASPWAYAQATRYRNMIHTAIDTQNWSLIGLVPKRAAR